MKRPTSAAFSFVPAFISVFLLIVALAPPSHAAKSQWVEYEFTGALTSVISGDSSGNQSNEFKGMTADTPFQGIFGFDMNATYEPLGSFGNSKTYSGAFRIDMTIGDNLYQSNGCSPFTSFGSNGVDVQDACGSYGDGTYGSSALFLSAPDVFGKNPSIRNALHLDTYEFATRNLYVQSFYTTEQGDFGSADVEGRIDSIRALRRATGAAVQFASAAADQWVEGWSEAFQGMEVSLPTVASPNPEPGTWVLLGTGVAALLRRRRNAHRAKKSSTPTV
jgi:hypothetical protein